ncbi:2050_t:CDS:1, partial [Cetraspora pellucida]
KNIAKIFQNLNTDKLDKNKIDAAVNQILISPDGETTEQATAVITTTSTTVDVTITTESGEKYHGKGDGTFNAGNGTSDGYLYTGNKNSLWNNTTYFTIYIDKNLTYIYFYDSNWYYLGHFDGSGIEACSGYSNGGVGTWSK